MKFYKPSLEGKEKERGRRGRKAGRQEGRKEKGRKKAGRQEDRKAGRLSAHQDGVNVWGVTWSTAASHLQPRQRTANGSRECHQSGGY